MSENRKRCSVPAIAALSVAAGLSGGCIDLMMPPRGESAEARPKGSDWQNLSLNMIVEKYGPPDRIDVDRVVWENKGPWRRIVVWDDMELRQMDLKEDDNIEEAVSYRVPKDKIGAVKKFDRHVRVSKNGVELSSRSFSEERNFLALNLADEIIREAKTPEEAREFYDATLRLADAGQDSPYMRKILFRPPPPKPPADDPP